MKEVVEVESSSDDKEVGNGAAKDQSNGSDCILSSTTPNANVNKPTSDHTIPSATALDCFSVNRVRRILRSQGDLRTTHDAIFLITAATAQFLHKLVEDAYVEKTRSNKKPSLTYEHLSSVVSKRKQYEFLSDFLPEKVRAGDALSERGVLEEEP